MVWRRILGLKDSRFFLSGFRVVSEWLGSDLARRGVSVLQI